MPDFDSPHRADDHDSQTFDQSVEDISGLLLDQEDQGDERDNAVSENHGEPGYAEDTTDAAVDKDAGTEGDVADEAGDPEDDELTTSDEARVTLDDGTETTVGELKRNTLFQRDYTRKTQELAEQRRFVESQQAELGDHAAALAHQRDLLITASQMFLPAEPDKEMLESDPVAYMQAKADHDERLQAISNLLQSQQAEQAMLSARAHQADQQMRASEARKLVETMPELNSREAYQQYWSDAVEVMGREYGFAPAELDAASDHRLYRAMRDLVRYHRARKNTANVSRELGNRPKLMRGTKRADPKTRNARSKNARAEKLRKTGDFEAGISALMDLDL